jgi:hypothetical protein
MTRGKQSSVQRPEHIVAPSLGEERARRLVSSKTDDIRT